MTLATFHLQESTWGLSSYFWYKNSVFWSIKLHHGAVFPRNRNPKLQVTQMVMNKRYYIYNISVQLFPETGSYRHQYFAHLTNTVCNKICKENVTQCILSRERILSCFMGVHSLRASFGLRLDDSYYSLFRTLTKRLIQFLYTHLTTIY